MPSMPFERQCESFRDLLEGLPMRHQEALDSFLEECTWQEIHRMIIRLHDMPEDRFIVLTVTLANASSEKFHSYMWILIAAASSQIYSTGPFTGGDVASDDAVDDPDEAMNNAETATDTMSVLSIGDDVDQVLERPDKAEPIGDNASKIVAGSEESEVNDAAEQLLKDVVHKEAFDGYGSISEAEDHPNNGKTSFTLSLREQLFGEKGIPQDIYVMVIEELFRSVYVPGVIIPSQYVDFDGYDYFADMDTCVVKSRLLHDINPILYEKYKQHYYTHNIWQIQSGDSSYTLDFLNLLPPEKYLQIRSVELAFSIEDSDLASSYYYIYEPELDLLANIEKYDEELRTISRELDDIWFWKFETICGLRLSKLKLDFSNAFSTEGEFLGLQAAEKFHAFNYEAPELTIVAPTPDLENQLVALFADLNT